MNKRVQAYVNEEVYEEIEKYSKSNNKKISDGLKDLILNGLNNESYVKEISKLSKQLFKNSNKLKFLVMLIEQVYSDLEIENPTDYRNNKILRKLERDFSMGINDE